MFLFLVVVQEFENHVQLVVQNLELFVAHRWASARAFGGCVRTFFAKRSTGWAALEATTLVILLKAVTAEHWFATIWFKWHFARRTTLCARGFVHGRWEALATIAESAFAEPAATTTKATFIESTATKTLSFPTKLIEHMRKTRD